MRIVESDMVLILPWLPAEPIDCALTKASETWTRKSPPDASQVWRAAGYRTRDQAADLDRQTGIWRVRRARTGVVRVGCMLGAEYDKTSAESRALGKILAASSSRGSCPRGAGAPSRISGSRTSRPVAMRQPPMAGAKTCPAAAWLFRVEWPTRTVLHCLPSCPRVEPNGAVFTGGRMVSPRNACLPPMGAGPMPSDAE